MVYLADLGSLNGTTVNGQAVGKIPVRLQPGTEVCFAGLCYQIRDSRGGRQAGVAAQRGGAGNAGAEAGKPRKPARTDRRQQFPFLVNKKSEVFARYSEQLPDQLKYLSRRHAHIFLRNDSLYIEDLGSTNGTYVSGTRLEEHARPLGNGDVIALGGECFVYRVELVYEDTEARGRDLIRRMWPRRLRHRGCDPDDVRHLGQLLPGYFLHRRRRRGQ